MKTLLRGLSGPLSVNAFGYVRVEITATWLHISNIYEFMIGPKHQLVEIHTDYLDTRVLEHSRCENWQNVYNFRLEPLFFKMILVMIK